MIWMKHHYQDAFGPSLVMLFSQDGKVREGKTYPCYLICCTAEDCGKPATIHAVGSKMKTIEAACSMHEIELRNRAADVLASEGHPFEVTS